MPLAIEGFLRQDYPDRELVILDDGTDPVGDLLPDDPRIRYERLIQRSKLGVKRNLACEAARGEVIVHWDDDDWYASDRISVQVEARGSTGADVCGLSSLVFYDPMAGAAWRYTYPQGDARPWVAGSSMCYTREFWERNRFDAVGTGEDTRFLWRSRSRNVLMMRREGMVVALLHEGNTSRKNTRGSRWRPVPEAEVVAIMGADTARYHEAATASTKAAASVASRTVTSAAAPAPAQRAQDKAAAPPAPAARRVLVGVPVTVEPQRLHVTLESLTTHTSVPYEVVLLPDGPSLESRTALARLNHLPQLSTAEPRGGAACFNRLVRHSEADVYVLLDSGARVAPGWLDRLLTGLDARPDNGLAGPSTNRAWNEQRLHNSFTAQGADPADVSERLWQRFRTETATLEPLYSLGDFCYAVRRDVVDAVGAADEGYGLGGRWEMDYNIRAARAGFRGVWVKGAYVERPPLTARRRHEEANHGPASRARYQAKFCGECPRADRRSGHCAGEECDSFARDLVVRLDFTADTAPAAAALVEPPPTALATTAPPSPRTPAAAVAAPERAAPLVSCIMPTGGRAELALRAAEYFRRQDYPHLELVVVDDGPPGLEQRLCEDDRVRYVHLSHGLSVGAKRNLACEHACGELIAQWDDDDWYAPQRITEQVAPILDGQADITGLRGSLFFDTARRQILTISAAAHRRMFAEDVVGGTLVYRRSVLSSASYPDRSVGEDARFLRSALRHGTRLERVPNDDLFVYIRHGDNSWHFDPGRYLGSHHWTVLARTIIPISDQAPYLAYSTEHALT